VKKLSMLDRILLLVAGLLAAYQVVVGIDGWGSFSIACFTIAFGVLLLAGLLLLILGFEVLQSPLVVIASTIIPLSLSLGLISAFLPAFQTAYLIFAILGLLAVILTRLFTSPKIAVLVLAVVHGIAGVLICFLPFWLSATGKSSPGFALVGLGGLLIGVGGLLLSFLKTGRPILSQETIQAILPGLLFLTTGSFVAGFILA